VTTVVLDAGVIIGALDAADAHHQASATALAGLSRNDLVVPASVLAEVLVRPYSRGPEVVERVERFLADLRVRIHPLDAPVAHAAARLRASHTSVRLPDALTLGTASVVGGTVLTTDRRWPQEIGVTVRLVTP
jgi:predicted nucleic acid-binding protein